MRRWNGWGSSAISLDLPKHGAAFLQQRIGQAVPLQDATLEQVLAKVPASRAPNHRLVNTEPEVRVRHARGQSAADWLAMRSGEFGLFPDGVAFPESPAEVRELLAWAAQAQIVLIPYGGGTSVAGHINPLPDQRPVITVSLARIKQLLDLDPLSCVATIGPGANGPEVESQLRAKGYTLGHFPQSWELSTVGGWVATRSSGQQSLNYGRIEQLFAGGTLETFAGPLELPTFPASAAGPDLREWVMGSEGRFGIISQVKLNVSKLPEQEQFFSVFLPDWQTALAAVRQLAQDKVALSMLRLSNPLETETQLALAASPQQIQWLNKYLGWRGVGAQKCLLTFAFTGSKAKNKLALAQTRALLKRSGAAFISKKLGAKWLENRFKSPYLREALWQLGYLVDTLETATPWSNTSQLMQQMEQAISASLAKLDTPTHVFSHLSHVYAQGSSIYTTYILPVADSYAATYQRWQAAKTAATQVIADHQGTLSHQHGVGRDHAPWLAQEKGALGIQAIRQVAHYYDPQQQLVPGILLQD
ncbi:FAD-binding oxidoreductase [Thiopseudomonas alkaliphila]|uniref:FAD-binding oxidoreductase n=1 Tax=Thiopseudomonas alkaliphila TaxID=1697053 RepID=UPI00069FCBB2|nr:FAD-binding oxidoreductase [Thiopseudomonas alkaliphila]AKX50555.1 FAD-linked oxidase [Thiopseudomonas alkaliphila]AKX56893.1 FAD-linked oxidase [Thiopseudomonas alkaliphila]